VKIALAMALLFAPFSLTCRVGQLHAGRMTLLSQIDEARHALEELSTDEAELARLQGDQVPSIQALKDGRSKDFPLLATLEAKGSALAMMLTEQRTRVVHARAQLVNLLPDVVGVGLANGEVAHLLVDVFPFPCSGRYWPTIHRILSYFNLLLNPSGTMFEPLMGVGN